MKNNEAQNNKKTEDRILSLWVSIGAAIGSVIGAGAGNFGLWVGIGVAFGAAVGFTLIKEKRSSD
jgi:hypothetical protein